MSIIEVNRVAKECKLRQLTSLKRTAVDSVSNSFVGAALAAKTKNCCLTLLSAFIDRKSAGINTTALNQWRRLTGQPVEERAPFKALDDVSFSVEQGEIVGIIGTNGASKTENWCLTPMVLARITQICRLG